MRDKRERDQRERQEREDRNKECLLRRLLSALTDVNGSKGHKQQATNNTLSNNITIRSMF